MNLESHVIVNLRLLLHDCTQQHYITLVLCLFSLVAKIVVPFGCNIISGDYVLVVDMLLGELCSFDIWAHSHCAMFIFNFDFGIS